MKILNVTDIRAADAYTIAHTHSSSIDLMEVAARQITHALLRTYPAQEHYTCVCGSGNNGGDGLAVARMLLHVGKTVVVFLCNPQAKTQDYTINLQRLEEIATRTHRLTITNVHSVADLQIAPHTILIDALLGIGVHTPLKSLYKDVVTHINSSSCIIVSIDIPSGLYADTCNKPTDTIVHATRTWTFQYPKLSLLLPENNIYTGEWSLVDIGLLPEYADSTAGNMHYTSLHDITLRQRNPVGHKGTFGHSLIIAGATQKMGAAILATQACISAGSGLVSACVPHKANNIMQIAIPEAMTLLDKSPHHHSQLPDAANFDAVGIGPGIGVHSETIQAFTNFITNCTLPIVIDADAINILASCKTLLYELPEHTILTPHPKEFDRLTHTHNSTYERIPTLQNIAKATRTTIVLKGAHSIVCTPEGELWFNSTGNNGMATAGSGDVLTGIITALLAQGYNSIEAAKLGVFVHGLAADIALRSQNYSHESLTATTIIRNLGKAFNFIKKQKTYEKYYKKRTSKQNY